ncbi:hypothetical protein HPDFL43_00020020 [Hoeflea phototrophica DFL-43]|uniref:Uncharacterized protein n=1 Tax=Hoeflea phototrophica (strain DSM 17068 / NCIMB 14078 / DFL-43) TaxID=411684 RepID=A0A094Z0C9_HOEPD|nr:hypothetical protein HPDFL43_00020020 [Hoeflea phototrophica DFL-43]
MHGGAKSGAQDASGLFTLSVIRFCTIRAGRKFIFV